MPTDAGSMDARAIDAAFDAAFDAAAETGDGAPDAFEADSGVDPWAGLPEIYVDGANVDARDDNSGSVSEPLATIGAALDLALERRSAGMATRVWVRPHTYREAIVRARVDSSGPLIVVQAVERGAAIISGSDVLTDWTSDGPTWVHPWSHDWFAERCTWISERRVYDCDPYGQAGAGAATEAGARRLGELFNRREVVWLEDRRLRQVLSETVLDAGTYFVDEVRDRLVVQPFADFAGEAEVAVRPVLFDVPGLSDFVLHGLVFEHANTPSSADLSAVRISNAQRVQLHHVVVRESNFDGLGLRSVDDVLVRDSFADDNGFNGLVGHITTNVLVERTSASRNNWRGHLGLVHGWAVGNKFLKARNLVFRELVAEDNLAHGLWLDFDHADTLVESSRFCGNLGHGLITEANQGPIILRNNTFCENGLHPDGEGAGLNTRETHGLELVENVFENNLLGMSVSGNVFREVLEHESCERGRDLGTCGCDSSDPATLGMHLTATGCRCHCLSNREWTVRGNALRGVVANGSTQLVWSTLSETELDRLFESADWDANTYSHDHDRGTFGANGCGWWVDLPTWQTCTGVDASSLFE